MQRFFLKLENFNGDNVTISDRDITSQMSRVLRMREGDQFIVLDNSGMEYVCSLEMLSEKNAKARIVDKHRNETEPEISLTLYQALPKKSALFELVLQKGTELGVRKFVPLITDRTERGELPKKDRLLKIIKEAAEQSERGILPELTAPQKLSDIMKIPQEEETQILLHCRGTPPLLSSYIHTSQTAQSYGAFIGPEGGFTEKEIELARAHGAVILSLGSRILRTETAGIVSAALLLS